MSRIHHHRREGRIIAPCHSHRWSDAGVQRLLDNLPLTINGATVEPTLCYVGGDADGTDWEPHGGYGETLTLQAGTAPSYDQKTPFHGSIDLAVKFNAGGFYKSASAIADIGTADFVIEIVYKHPTGSTAVISNFDGSAPFWDMFCVATTTNFSINDGINSATLVASVTDGSWQHIIVFGNRDEASTNGAMAFVSGVGGSGVDISAVGSIVSDYLAIGAYGPGSSNTNACVAAVSLYTGANMHQAGAAGPAEWATIAAERFALLTGSKVHKSWNGVTLPTTNTCDAATYLYKVESGATKLHLVGKNHLKICSKAISGVGNVKFALMEGAAENLFTYSRDLTNWNLQQVTAPSVATELPDGASISTATLAEDAANDRHQIYSSVALEANAVYCVSAVAKKINRKYLRLGITAGGVGYAQGCVDLETGAVEDLAGGLTPIDLGTVQLTDDFWLAWMTAQNGANTDPFGHYQSVLDSSKNEIFQGVSQNSITLAMLQLEKGDHPSSRVSTIASAVTRPVATLKEDITGLLGGTFSIRGSFVAPTFTPAAKKVVCHLAADASNYIQIYIDTDGTLKAATAIGTGDAGAVACAGSVCNDKLTRFQLSGQADKLLLQYRQHDDTVSTVDVDTSVDIPLALTELSIGHDATPAYHFGPCGLADLQISRTFSASLSEPFSGHSVLDLS